MPTFLIFKDGDLVQTISGADKKALTDAVTKFAAGGVSETAAGAAGKDAPENAGFWFGAAIPKSYQNITDEVELKNIDLLNCNNDVGPGKTLFYASSPSGLNPKTKAKDDLDWVESDADEQLMLFMPFQSSIKLHSLHITSLPPKDQKDDDDEVAMRPKTIKLYTNRSHILGFDAADDIDPTQEIKIAPEDWDEKTGTAKVELRFVKFQRISSLILYFVDGDGDSEKLRVDRIRLFGEAGEPREQGKLEKIGDAGGE